MSEFDPTEVLNSIGTLIADWGLSVVGAIAVLLIGRWIAARVKKGAQLGAERAKIDSTLAGFLSQGAYWLVLAFVMIAVLGIFGIPTASFVAVLGAAGLAVGLAFQGTLSNFSAGVMLLLFRPVSVGDYVEVSGQGGTVKSISIFSTSMDTPDNIRVIVPNSQVFGQVIKNYSHNDTRRIDLVIGVDYGDNLQTAKDAILRIVTADERVLDDPAPVVAVDALGASSVDFVVRPWVASSDYWEARRDLVRALKEGLEEAGCSFPFPQRDVHLFEETA